MTNSSCFIFLYITLKVTTIALARCMFLFKHLKRYHNKIKICKAALRGTSQDLTGALIAHWTQQSNRTRQRPCFPQYPPNPRAVCISCGCSLLPCSTYPVPANTRHSSAQTPLCSHSGRSRNQQNRPVSFEIPSSLHRQWSGHNTHQRDVRVDCVNIADSMTAAVNIGTIFFIHWVSSKKFVV